MLVCSAHFFNKEHCVTNTQAVCSLWLLALCWMRTVTDSRHFSPQQNYLIPDVHQGCSFFWNGVSCCAAVATNHAEPICGEHCTFHKLGIVSCNVPDVSSASMQGMGSSKPFAAVSMALCSVLILPLKKALLASQTASPHQVITLRPHPADTLQSR